MATVVGVSVVVAAVAVAGPAVTGEPPVDSSKRTLTLAVEDNFDDLDLETEVRVEATLLLLLASSSKFLAALGGGLTLLLLSPPPPQAPNDLRLLLASQLV